MDATMMHATMMHRPLTTQLILERGARLFADSQVLSLTETGVTAQDFATTAARAARLAAALGALGLAPGDRVGTFAWNGAPHLEAYLGVPAAGYVLHTLNLRLFPEQVAFLLAHAEDRAVLVEASLAAQFAAALGQCTALEHIIVAGANGVLPAFPGFLGQVHDYEALLAAHDPLAEWPALDETAAAVACYTSGTTGNPKGVVYSHRTIMLHSMGSLGVDAFAMSHRDRVLMLPPMFHANAWGMPFSAWLAGADMVMPGPFLQPAHIARAIAQTRPTVTAAVPTILNDLLAAHARQPLDMASFRMIVAGGSAVSPALVERVHETWGVPLVQGWGMTETSPLCVLSHPPRGTPPHEEAGWRAKSGRPVAGVETRVVDDAGVRLPEDGRTVGRLQLRGLWIARGYHREEPGQSPLTADGWLDTGDVGTIDPRGYVHVTDRTKDLIKSGGEWISSADLERAIARYPGLAEVAVVAVPDPRWEERPLAVVVPADPASVPDFAAIRAFLGEHVARFMVPEYWAALTNLPKTSVGKIDKKQLRELVGSGSLAYTRVGGVPVAHAR